ncbi:F-box/FBD/LRR-repeat protein At1g13570-like [Triticum dicoccoides]|uniref:F-box/FBD/LRR-repeat protein At1g13570-like n=1 Tax=Triticum dicoccoides TaxID=85692 RepID=UPI00188F7E25|nr:F-box/FBD/LRR-repeat protein At1g13570-like [Triticum dicoccoides]
MGNYLTSRITAEKHAHVKQQTSKNRNGRPGLKFHDLPEDVLCTILSKLPAKEAVRTSVLSTDWRCTWTACPRLSFGVDDVSTNAKRKHQHTQMFIDRVNAVLTKHSGRAVDQLEIKFIFETKLVDHLNNWIRFAMSAHTKSLAFDLAPPDNFPKYGDHYRFPFEQFTDNKSVSCLACLQLSFVCFEPPPANFIGFPNLRKLHLHVLKTTRQDLESILSSCVNLEWLSLLRCHLKDQMKVVRRPLSHLRYLKVVHCDITKIEFNAPMLSTFVYDGPYIPITLHHAAKLENATIRFLGAVFQHCIASLLNGLPDVHNLTLHLGMQELEARWMLNSPRVFSHLRHVQILLIIHYEEYDKILYLVSFLRVAPFIEKLEVHFHDIGTLWFATDGPLRQEMPPCEDKLVNLKDVRVTGFRGARGQAEFLMHVVENAPAIEVVTVDTAQRLTDAWDPDEPIPRLDSAALDMVRAPLLKTLPPNAKVSLI